MAELNQAIRGLVDDLNVRPMRGWGTTRRALYEQLGFRSCGTIEQWVPGPQLTYALANGTTPASRRTRWP